MTAKHSRAGLLLCALLVMACAGSGPPDADATAAAADSVAAEPGREPGRPGIRFDPETLQPGDTVGELVADSVRATPTIVDSSHVGTAWFHGRIELSGSVLPHFDEDMRESTVCFEADPASAARLPRWEGDERRPWFCFTNTADAAGLRGMADSSAIIVIDEFTIHRGMSDEVNSARLVDVVSDSTRAASGIGPD